MKERLAIFAAGAAIVLLLALGLTGGVLLGRLLPSGDKPRIADTTAVIGAMDIVFGECDR